MANTDRLSAALEGRYRIERELGAGGMATVYLAEDLKHHRKVAIKVLRPELTAELGAERFLREVSTTAGLRHPNILPLYDSGEAAGFLYYVMPVVEGESLRDRLDHEKQLPIEDAIRLTREIAGALSYAQAHGVIHRDIKPENILLDSGHAVVADFGIARAIDAASGETLTQTGLAIGTPKYMSPEQASGSKDIDGRSDLYALACVLFEMLSGQPPFRGPTAESVVYQHLSVEAPPITNLRPSVPVPVAAALRRALAKTPADRFATVAGFSDALTGTGAPGVSSPGTTGRRLGIGVALAAIIGLAAIWLLIRPHLSTEAAATLQLGRQLQVTRDPGLEIDPALSRDGKLLAYSGADGVLFIRQVDGGDPVRVIRGSNGKGRWPHWTPNGDRVVFLSPQGVEVVPALGGSPHLIASEAGNERGIALSPGGDSVAFVVLDSLFVKPIDGGSARLVTTSHEMHSPAWSLDGRWIAFASGNPQYVSIRDRSLGNAASSSVQVVPSAGGAPILVTGDQATNVSPAWAPDGALLYVSDQEGSRDVYETRLSKSGHPIGLPVRLTTGLNVHGIALAQDGSRLAYSSFSETSNVWALEIPARGSVSIARARPLTTRNQVIENMGVSHDGRWLAYSSNVNGTINHLFRVRLDQPQTEQQLTMDSVGAYWSAWSPDDREIAFHRFSGERRQIFVLPVEGGTPTAVTDGLEDDRSPEWSPDGQHLVFLANWAVKGALKIVDRQADGRWSAPYPFPVVVGTDTITPGLAVWSPDGRSLACGCGPGGLVLIPWPDGPARRLPSPFSTAGWAFPQWSADGETVFHLAEDSANGLAVVAVPISGDPPHIVVQFDDPARPWHRFGFRVRQNRMFFTLGDQESDIWVTELRSLR